MSHLHWPNNFRNKKTNKWSMKLQVLMEQVMKNKSLRALQLHRTWSRMLWSNLRKWVSQNTPLKKPYLWQWAKVSRSKALWSGSLSTWTMLISMNNFSLLAKKEKAILKNSTRAIFRRKNVLSKLKKKLKLLGKEERRKRKWMPARPSWIESKTTRLLQQRKDCRLRKMNKMPLLLERRKKKNSWMPKSKWWSNWSAIDASVLALPSMKPSSLSNRKKKPKNLL